MKFHTFLFAACLLFAACNSGDDVDFQPVKVNFSSATVPLEAGNESADITVSLSRAAETDINLLVNIIQSGVDYGNQFTTFPESSGGVIPLTIAAGQTSAHITVTKDEEVLLDGDEYIVFSLSIADASTRAEVGTSRQTRLVFGSIISGGGRMTLEGKTIGSNYTNSVYVDFSANRQTSVNRKSWTLGFYRDGGKFTVFLNGAYETAATMSAKSNIDDITLEDAENAINLNASPMSFTSEFLSPDAVDSPDGSPEGTVFGNISAIPEENRVFFVATADNKNNRGEWYKVVVYRNGVGYTVRYGRVDNSIPAFTTIIPIGNTRGDMNMPMPSGEPGYNLRFLSLETHSLVTVEPKAAQWDIMWGYNTGFTAVDMNGAEIGYRPYFMQDLIFINNLGGVEAAQVMTADIAYADYSAADIASTDFSGSRDVIGSNWRVTAGPASGVYDDRYYVIKDPAGNYYKMQAVSAGLGSPAAGERGRPVIRYELVE